MRRTTIAERRRAATVASRVAALTRDAVAAGAVPRGTHGRCGATILATVLPSGRISVVVLSAEEVLASFAT